MATTETYTTLGADEKSTTIFNHNCLFIETKWTARRSSCWRYNIYLFDSIYDMLLCTCKYMCTSCFPCLRTKFELCKARCKN